MEDYKRRAAAQRLDQLADLMEQVRSAKHPAVRATALAQLQRLSGWALRDAVDECRDEGLAWRDIAPAAQIPFGTLYRQYKAGGRIVIHDVKVAQDPETYLQSVFEVPDS